MKDVFAALLPSREDLRLMVNVEDRFGRPHKLRELILAWHYGKERLIPDIAAAWGIDAACLRRWMAWYQIPELEIEKPALLPKPVPVVRPVHESESDSSEGESSRTHDLSSVTLRSTTPGYVALKIEQQWNRLRSWDEVAKAMDCTREELRVWVKQRLGAGLLTMTSSVHLRLLLDGENSSRVSQSGLEST